MRALWAAGGERPRSPVPTCAWTASRSGRVERYYDAPLEALAAIQALFAGDAESITEWLEAFVDERAEELRRDVGLRTHVADVLAAVKAAGEPCVLVGHSYAGLVVREAADRAPGEVHRVILVDGWAGGHGTSLFGLAPSWFVDGLRAAADRDGDGWTIPAPDPALVGVVDPEQAAWVRERLTAHPLQTFVEGTALTGAVDDVPGSAIVCRPGAGLPFDGFAGALGYDIEDLESGHDAMVLAPAELARLLLREARR
jgi:pimeloyl-ACP methyl ester carboxylesterase